MKTASGTNRIKVIGIDPSTSNFGIAKVQVCPQTYEVKVDDLVLIETESEAKKGVIKSSDDLRRAREVYEGMQSHCQGYAMAIGEIPFMNPAGYALANWNAAMMLGLLAACPLPLIQVTPQEVKLAAVGHRQAAKEEMIEWAMAMHPDAPWRVRTVRGVSKPTAANEHLADALAAVYAGIKTQQFKQAMAIYTSAVTA